MSNDPAVRPPSDPVAPPSIEHSALSTASPRRHRALFVLMLSVQTVALLLVLGEILTRLFLPVADQNMFAWPYGYFVHDPVSNVYHQSVDFPPTWMQHLGNTRRNLVYSNSLGMRDVPVPPPAPGQIRILVMGSSQTEGMAISDSSQPWPRQLEEALNSQAGGLGRRYVVMNGGVAGFNNFQAIARGVQLDPLTKPDIWIMDYFSQMWYRNVFGPEGQYDLIWGFMFNRTYFEQVYPAGTLRRRLADWSMLFRRALFEIKPIDMTVMPFRTPYQDLAVANRDAVERFKSSAARAGRPALIAYISSLADLDKDDSSGHDIVYPLIKATCDSMNVPLLDPTPDLIAYKRSHDPDMSYVKLWACSDRDVHYLPPANRIYAQGLARLLLPELKRMAEKDAASTMTLGEAKNATANSRPALQ